MDVLGYSTQTHPRGSERAEGWVSLAAQPRAIVSQLQEGFSPSGASPVRAASWTDKQKDAGSPPWQHAPF